MKQKASLLKGSLHRNVLTARALRECEGGAAAFILTLPSLAFFLRPLPPSLLPYPPCWVRGCGTQNARGEPDFSEPREEDTDYWNEDEPPVKAAHTAAKRTDPFDAISDQDDNADIKKRAARKAAKPADPFDAIADRDDRADHSAADALDAAADADDGSDRRNPTVDYLDATADQDDASQFLPRR